MLVRSGLREVEARVLEVYGPNDSQLLAMPLHGADGEVLVERTVSLPMRPVCFDAVAHFRASRRRVVWQTGSVCTCCGGTDPVRVTREGGRRRGKQRSAG